MNNFGYLMSYCEIKVGTANDFQTVCNVLFYSIVVNQRDLKVVVIRVHATICALRVFLWQITLTKMAISRVTSRF